MSVPADRPPPRDIPVAVPGDLVFVRQPRLVAYAGAFTVSSAGFEFTVRITADVTGHPELVPQSWALHLDQRARETWLEVRFADGRACATDLNTSTWPGTSRDIRLKFLSGEGSTAHWWVSPLPPPGPVELALHLNGQTACAATLDAGTLLDAAATVERA